MSRRAWWLASGLVLAYLGFTAWAWSGEEAVRVGDSYRTYPNSWLDFSGVLDTLNGGVATPFIYASLHQPVLIAGQQVFMFAIATSLLALATLHRLRGQWVGWVLASMVLAISLLPVFWSSHLVLAPESLVFTAATLWLASVVWLTSARRGEWRPLIANTAAFALLALVRPGAMLVLLPAQFILLVWWGRDERSGRAAFAAMLATIPFAAFAGFRVWQIAVADQWPLASLAGALVDDEASFRDYALAFTWAWDLPAQVSGGVAPALSSLHLMTWTDDAALPRSLDSLLMPSASPWLLLGLCLATGTLLGFAAGARPRVRLAGVAGLVLAIAPLACFVFFGWAVSGLDFGRVVLPFLPMAAIAALVLPATIPQRPERAKRAALADVTSRWTSPVAPVEGALS